VAPRVKESLTMQRGYRIYREIYPALQPVFSRELLREAP
jgi:hypothetical protein